MTTQELIRRPILFAISVIWLWIKEHYCNPIGYPRSQQYAWHGQWRLDLVKRRIKRNWGRFSFKDFLKKERWFWVLLAGFAACAISLWVITDGLWLTLPTKENFTLLRSSTGSWTLLTALISAPIAFVLWWFRDTNSLWQIENQRKDTNLKDFQQLSQWASGLHLIEAEKTVTTNEGTTSEAIKTNLAVTMNGNDRLRPPSRADGAASLQIAAVYQLQAFLRGDYGEHFQRPAFALLKTVWLSLVQTHLNGWEDEFTKILSNDKTAREDKKEQYRTWHQGLSFIIKSPLAVAINDALIHEYGRALVVHKNDLPNATFAGMQVSHIEVDGLNLTGINLQSAELNRANLQGATLWDANLRGAQLGRANLQGTTLNLAQLQGAYLREANFQDAKLWRANLQGSDLSSASLQGAYLREADLQGAYLTYSNLQGANLKYAKLQGAHLTYAKLQGAKITSEDIKNIKLSEEQRNQIIIVERHNKDFAFDDLE